MAITAAQVKELRERTGIPMMKCKEALTACAGDMDAAVDHLRKQGMATADKKAHRETRSGACGVACAGGRGLIVFVACETDFVGSNDQFRSFVQEVADAALAQGCEDVEALKSLPLADGRSVADGILGLVQKIGENIRLEELLVLDGDTVVGYNHGSRVVSTLVSGSGDDSLLRNVAMHVAAASPAPIALRPEDIDEERVAKEREILAQSEEVLAKPEQIRPKIIEGKLKRFYKEYVLLEQEMLVGGDGKQSVAQYAKEQGLVITGFIRKDLD